MTTEEALAVAEAVQFGDRFGNPNKMHGRGSGKYPHAVGVGRDKDRQHMGDLEEEPSHESDPADKPTGKREHMRRHWEDPEHIDQKYGREGRGGRAYREKRQPTGHHAKPTVHIQKVGSMHFSEDATQFAEAHKSRQDAAERSAMRRAIYYADIHPAIKEALLNHSGAVQFTDGGTEVPSVPLSWVLAAARGILQMAYDPQTMGAMRSGDAWNSLQQQGVGRIPVHIYRYFQQNPDALEELGAMLHRDQQHQSNAHENYPDLGMRGLPAIFPDADALVADEDEIKPASEMGSAYASYPQIAGHRQ